MSIYAQSHHTDATLDRITRSPQTTATDTDAVRTARKHMEAQGLSERRQLRYMQTWRRLVQHVDGSLIDADLDTIRGLVAAINRGELWSQEVRPWTKAEYRKGVKKLLTIHGREELVAWIRTHPPENEKPVPDRATFPDPDMVRRLIDATKNMRDAALISSLWDTGARIGELLACQWQHVREQGDSHLRIRLPKSKTKKRTVPVSRDTTERLEKWREKHPGPDPAMYVWSPLQEPRQISYRAIRDMLLRTKDRAGIPDRIDVNPHAFRKGRATHLGSQDTINAPKLMQVMGWKKLETAKRYIDLGSDTTDRALIDLYGEER